MPQKLLIGTPVWGVEYVNRLFQISLRSLLHAELPPFPTVEIEVRIITTHDDLERIFMLIRDSEWPSWASFRVYADPGLEVMVHRGDDKYQIAGYCFSQVIRSSPKDAILVWNFADFVWSKNSLVHTIQELGDLGHADIVGVAGLPIDGFAIQSVIQEHLEGIQGLGGIDEHTLISLALDSTKWFYDLNSWNTYPPGHASVKFHSLGSAGYLVNILDLHPAAFRVTNRKGVSMPLLTHGTVDGYLLPFLQENGWVVSTVTESSQMVLAGSVTRENLMPYQRNCGSKFTDSEGQLASILEGTQAFLDLDELPHTKWRNFQIPIFHTVKDSSQLDVAAQVLAQSTNDYIQNMGAHLAITTKSRTMYFLASSLIRPVLFLYLTTVRPLSVALRKISPQVRYFISVALRKISRRVRYFISVALRKISRRVRYFISVALRKISRRVRYSYMSRRFIVKFRNYTQDRTMLHLLNSANPPIWIKVITGENPSKELDI
jgi:hypothetical protein